MAENKPAPHSFVKDGVYYFVRRVPKDLLHHYTSPKISFSLRTRSASVATSRALRAAQRLDEHWYFLRINDCDLPGKHMLRLAQNTNAVPAMMAMTAATAETVKLSEAVGIYLRLKGQGRPVTFHRAAERSCGYVIDVCGDKDITAYTKADANAFRDDLIKRGLSDWFPGATVKRWYPANRPSLTGKVAQAAAYIEQRLEENPTAPILFQEVMGYIGCSDRSNFNRTIRYNDLFKLWLEDLSVAEVKLPGIRGKANAFQVDLQLFAAAGVKLPPVVQGSKI